VSEFHAAHHEQGEGVAAATERRGTDECPEDSDESKKLGILADPPPTLLPFMAERRDFPAPLVVFVAFSTTFKPEASPYFPDRTSFFRSLQRLLYLLFHDRYFHCSGTLAFSSSKQISSWEPPPSRQLFLSSTSSICCQQQGAQGTGRAEYLMSAERMD
jgi:hypothetical protein